MNDLKRLPKALNWPLRLTHAGLLAERLTQAFWPLWSVAFVAVALWGTGWLPSFSFVGLWAAILCVAAATLYALWHAWRFRVPTRAEAIARLDQTLPGRPIQALTDDPLVGGEDAASQAVWAAHLARMEKRLENARATPADLRVSRADPYALRYGAVLVLAVTLLFGGVWRGEDLSTGLGTGAAQAVQTGPAWEVWLEPPRYTGRPILYLADVPEGDVEVPLGTQVIVRLYGEVGALSVAQTLSASSDPATSSEPAQSFTADTSGTLSIEGPNTSQLWSIVLLPDQLPAIAHDADPTHEPPSGMRLPFSATDDYGVESAQASIQIDLSAVDRRYGLAVEPEPREDLVLDLPLPISGDRADFSEILIDDISKHPFANLPVTIKLSATDAAMQVGFAEPFTAELPGRSFFNPLANAIIEQRRDLLWSRENQARTAQILRTITYDPEVGFDRTWPYFLTRMVLAALENEGPLTVARRDELAEVLWNAALRIEENSLDGALERLRQAQERLSEAIRQGASPEEIQRLMDEMRQAMDEYLRQRAQQEARNQQQSDSDQPQNQQGEGQEITRDQLDELLDRIQELMEQGRTAEAQQLLQELQQLMENLELSQNQNGQGDGQPSPGEQAMQDLRETLRDQQDLSDEAFRELQEQFDQGQQPGQQQGQQQGEGQQPGQQPGDQQGQQQGNQPGSNRSGSLAGRQGDLRDRLEQLRRSMPGQGTPEGDAARRALEDAERAMDDAAEGLSEDRFADALDDQARAMDALREGMDQLGRAMAEAQQQGQGQQDGDGMEFGDTATRDPLGRDRSGDGQLDSNGRLAEGGEASRRARELQDEIRRRSAEQERPEVERDYLNRLLDRF